MTATAQQDPHRPDQPDVLARLLAEMRALERVLPGASHHTARQTRQD